MPSVIKSNITPFIQGRVQNRAKFLAAVENRLTRQELAFIHDIKTKQMSGQNGKLYTNVVEGMLRRQWYNDTVKQNQSVKAIVWSTTPYAPHLEASVHPDGIDIFPKNGKALRWKSGGKWHFAKKVHLPARLRIGEAWERDFVPEMTRIITQAAKEFL